MAKTTYNSPSVFEERKAFVCSFYTQVRGERRTAGSLGTGSSAGTYPAEGTDWFGISRVSILVFSANHVLQNQKSPKARFNYPTQSATSKLMPAEQ